MNSPLGNAAASPHPKKKKKKKRRHSEMEGESEPAIALPAVPNQPQRVEATQAEAEQTVPASDNRRKKKKKKKRREEQEACREKGRKRPREDGEECRDQSVKQRECVQSHLEPATQEEEWCQGGSWSLNPPTKAQGQAKQRLPQQELAAARPGKTTALVPTQPQPEPSQREQGSDPTVVLKKKKKRKRKKMRPEGQSSVFESSSVAEDKTSKNGTGDSTGPEKKLKKKKKRRLKEEVNECEEHGHQATDRNSDPAKMRIASTAAVIAWDSQVKDGYKRRQAPAADLDGGDAPPVCPAPTAAWDGKKSSNVVEELLKNSADKAYGAHVLSWEGETSAISRDAIDDARCAKLDTVIDEWDEEFDSGKVQKVKRYKREKRRSGNLFQKIQDRKNMWSVTPGGKKGLFGSISFGGKKSGFRR